MRRLALVAVGVLVAAVALTSLSAGVGFATPAGPAAQSAVNKLAAVVNNLDSLHARLIDALAHPPEPGKSGINGAIGRLDAMAGKLDVLFDRVVAANPPPDDDTPPPDDIRPALLRVRDGARAIATAAQPPPDDTEPPPDDTIGFRTALAGVADAAQALADLAADLLRGGPIGGGMP